MIRHDSVSLHTDDGQTQMDVVMDARPYKLMARIMIPFIKGMVGKFMAKDMDAVTAYCDRVGSAT